MKRLLTSLLIISVMSVMLGQGVVSFMSDTETSSGNTFTAGTIDLQVDDKDHPPALIQLPDLRPCEETMDVFIPYRNVGTNPGTVTLQVAYHEEDNEVLDTDPYFEFSAYHDPDCIMLGECPCEASPGDGTLCEVSDHEFSKKVYITKATATVGADVVNLMPTLLLYAEGVYPAEGAILDGKVSIFEFAWMDPDPYTPGTNIPRTWPLGELLFPGSGETLTMRFHLDGMVGNEYQADGIASTLNFAMNQFVPDRSLVLDLEMNEGSDGVAYDSSLYGNDGTIYGAAWTSSPPYKGYALDFDGTDDYVQVPDSPSLDITGAITVEAWAYWEGNGDYEFITTKAGEQYELVAMNPGGSRRIGCFPTAGLYIVSGADAFPANQWNHVVCTYTSGVGGEIYVNGALVTQASSAASLTTSTADFFIGQRLGGAYRFDGVIDRVRVYNRALSPEEVFYSYLVSYSHYHGAP